MSWNYRYEVKQIGEECAVIRKDWTDVAQYFAGYDFMGSVNWETDSDKAEMNSEDIAWDIVNDLLNADADDKPEEPKEEDKNVKRTNNLKSEETCYMGQLKMNGKWSTVTNECDSENLAHSAINRLLDTMHNRPDGIRIVKVTTTYEVV